MRILITGAGGFVGQHAMRAFGKRLGTSDRLVGVGRHAPTVSIPDLDIRDLDILDREKARTLIREEQPTHVLHLAALASVQQSSGSPAETWRVNVGGLLNLAEAVAAETTNSTFLFVSSSEVYGRAFLCGHALDESAVPDPVSTYGRTKLVGEQLLADILSAAGVKLIVLRPFSHIGAGQDERFVVPSFANQIARIEAGRTAPVVEVGDLSAERDFLDVADVVAAYRVIAEKSDAIPSGSIFNIASGRARPISEILHLLKARARASFEVRVAADRMRPSDIKTACGDSSRLKQAVGWQPTVKLSDSIDAIMDDARTRLGPG